MNKLLLVSVLFFGAAVSAAPSEGGHSGSEFYYQAGAGTQDVTGKFMYDMGESAGTDFDGFRLGAEYERGLSDVYSVGAQLMYKSHDFDGGGKVEGLMDLEVFVKGHAMEGALRYGAVLEYALDDSETKSNGDANAYSGGAMIQPYIGYQFTLPSAFAGVKVHRDIEIMAADYVDKVGGTKEEVEGGEEMGLTAYYEHHMNGMKIGGRVTLLDTEDMTSKDKATGVKTKEKGSDGTEIAVYGAIPCGQGEVLPALIIRDEDSDAGDYEMTTIQAAYRMAF